jgi:hypothetical protein
MPAASEHGEPFGREFLADGGANKIPGANHRS